MFNYFKYNGLGELIKLSPVKSIKTNKKALFDYEILTEFEAGLVLQGSEVKSIKLGNVNFKGSFLKFYKNELFLLNMYIGKFKPAGKEGHPEERNIKVLLKKKELEKLFLQTKIKGNAIIPIEIYLKNNFIKVKIAVGKGKKKYEKKNIIKERDQKREIGRKLKNLR